MKNWKIGKLENRKIGTLENWNIGKLENRKIGKLENWKIGRFENWKNWKIGKLENPLHAVACSPFMSKCRHSSTDPMVERVERQALAPKVVGSSPTGTRCERRGAKTLSGLLSRRPTI